MHKSIGFSVNFSPLIFYLSELHAVLYPVRPVGVACFCYWLIHSSCASVYITLLEERTGWLAAYGDLHSSTFLPHSLPTLTTGCSVHEAEQDLETSIHSVINKIRKLNQYHWDSIVKNKVPSLFSFLPGHVITLFSLICGSSSRTKYVRLHARHIYYIKMRF